jgi:hypothetical protein
MSKSTGNGLGEKNAKSWNPSSMRTVEKGNKHAGAGQKNVESGKRKGAGQK